MTIMRKGKEETDFYGRGEMKQTDHRSTSDITLHARIACSSGQLIKVVRCDKVRVGNEGKREEKGKGCLFDRPD